MAESERVDLGTYDGRDIISCGIVIPGAGGGLREALGLDPIELHYGDQVDVLLRCTVGKHTHDPILDKHKEDTGNLNLVYTLDVNKGTILTDTTIGDKAFTKLSTRLAAAQAARAKREQAEAEKEAGVIRLPGTEDT
jgi:hypothetical protein